MNPSFGVKPQRQSNASAFFQGSPEIRENISTLLPEQQGLYNQLQSAANGSFGQSANYYRNLLSDNPSDLEAFAAPEQRRFQEQIIPGLAEQFAGMGSGGLESSGFRNATVNAGRDLAERIAMIRANLRQQGAQGLQNIGQFGLGNFSQPTTTQQGTPGVLAGLGQAFTEALPAIGTAAGAYFGGPPGAAAGAAAAEAAKRGISSLTGNKSGQTSPYGQNRNIPSPPTIQDVKFGRR